MNMITCEDGHRYDRDKYIVCPYCNTVNLHNDIFYMNYDNTMQTFLICKKDGNIDHLNPVYSTEDITQACAYQVFLEKQREKVLWAEITVRGPDALELAGWWLDINYPGGSLHMDNVDLDYISIWEKTRFVHCLNEKKHDVASISDFVDKTIVVVYSNDIGKFIISYPPINSRSGKWTIDYIDHSSYELSKKHLLREEIKQIIVTNINCKIELQKKNDGVVVSRNNYIGLYRLEIPIGIPDELRALLLSLLMV